MSDIQYSAAADRNKAPICAELLRLLAERARVLEIASGTGQHAEHFADRMPWLTWLPSDPDPQSQRSITARIHHSGLANIQPPVALDVLEPWPALQVDVVFSANMLHISPIQTLPALCAGARSVLSDCGLLLIYGPFKRHGRHTAGGNADFDVGLRSRNPLWGIRDLEDVLSSADTAGFKETEVLEMPANNLLLVFTATS